MKIVRFFNIAIWIMLLATIVSATPQTITTYTPKPGSTERKAILDALRKPVQKDMHQKVIFHDVSMKVKGDWAYVDATGRDSIGNRLKRWGSELDPGFQALLHKNKNTWQVLSWGAGTGMDATVDARKSYPQAPKSIFPPDAYDFPGDVQESNDSTKTQQRQSGKSRTSRNEWVTVATFEGDIKNFNRKTELFKVGPRWKIDWVTEEGQYGSQGSLVIFVTAIPQNPYRPNYGDAAGQAVSHNGGGSGTSLEYGEGEYYLQILSNQHHVVRILTHR